MTTKTKTTKQPASKAKTTATKKPTTRAKTPAPAQIASDNIGGQRQTVALRLLTPSPENVRRFQSEAGIDELAANIEAVGLLQNLTVRKGEKGKLEVIAGARRLRALKELAKRGATIKPEGVAVTLDYPVPVLVQAQNQNATEVSLSENIVRENMHVADQVEAFRKLIDDDNMSPEQVGDHFGISHMTVRRRVKLAKVSPRVMDAFRAGEVTLQDMEAFAVSDDHAAQEAAFDGLPVYNRNPDAIRARLTSEKIAGDHRLAQFVGIDAYKEAGGTITRDLFAEDDDDAFLDSKPLVMTLASNKLASLAEEIRDAEGWKWAEYYLSEREAPSGLPRLATYERDQTDAEREEIAALTDYLETNEGAYEQGDLQNDAADEYEAKTERLDDILASCNVFKPEEMAFAGVIVTLDYQGDVAIRRGLVRKDDAHDLAALHRREAYATTEEQRDEDGDETQYTQPSNDEAAAQQIEEGPQLSQAVIEDLTKAHTAALAVEVAARPDVALACIVHALASRIVYGGSSFGYSPLAVEITPKTANLKCDKDDADNAAPFEELMKLDDAWTKIFPAKGGDLWQWCIDAKRDQLLSALAYLVGRTVNAVNARHEGGSYYAPRFSHAAQIAEAVSLDMTKWWTPGQDFFDRVPKAVAMQAVKDVGGAESVVKAMEKASKSDAIKIAREHVEGKAWLPTALRTRLATSNDYLDEEDEAAGAFAKEDGDNAPELESGDEPQDEAYHIAAE